MTDAVFNNILQIGVVVHSVDNTVEKYRSLLGLQDWHINFVDSEKGIGRNFKNRGLDIKRKTKIAWIKIGNVELELIEPQDEESDHAAFLREHGQGIHHVMFASNDYDATLSHMLGKGYQAVSEGELQSGRIHVFDTLEDLGLLCEIAEGETLVPDYSVGDVPDQI